MVTPCFNEAPNLRQLITRIRQTLLVCGVDYEHIVIDNASTDGTVEILREEARLDPRIKVILNVSNFGHLRSPYHALLQSEGDCVILMASDLQDPPELIPRMLDEWLRGAKVVMLVKDSTEERGPTAWTRRLYYGLLGTISSTRLVANATGSGLYDKDVINYLRGLQDPYPYLRGLVAESGYPLAVVPFEQPRRQAGRSKNHLSDLYDTAMLGITTHSRTPLRLMSLVGFGIAALSSLAGAYYLVRKLASWDSFDLGLAPVATGLFFLGSVQLIFMGLLGEYVGNIFLRLRGLPLVVESERINFTETQSAADPLNQRSMDDRPTDG